MKIATAPLTKNQLNEMIDYIVLFFNEYKKKKAVVYYGWNCRTENLYKDIKIDVKNITSFIEKSKKNDIYFLGESDLYLADIKGNFEFQLCHESDAHFSSKNKKLIYRVFKDWGRKYKPYKQKHNINYSAAK